MWTAAMAQVHGIKVPARTKISARTVTNSVPAAVGEKLIYVYTYIHTYIHGYIRVVDAWAYNTF
jgi:hypothetical protein